MGDLRPVGRSVQWGVLHVSKSRTCKQGESRQSPNCKPLKEPRNRFTACRAGTTNRVIVPARKTSVHRLAESIPRNPGLLKRLRLSHFKGPPSQDQQKTIGRRLITSHVTLAGRSHLLIFLLRKVTLTKLHQLRTMNERGHSNSVLWMYAIGSKNSLVTWRSR
jgi:hypothetical protein